MIISPHPGAGWVSSCDACHNVMMAVMTQSSLPWPGSWQGHSTRNQLEMQITTNTNTGSGQTGHRQRGGGLTIEPLPGTPYTSLVTRGWRALPVTTAVCTMGPAIGKPVYGYKMTQLHWNLNGNLKRMRRTFQKGKVLMLCKERNFCIIVKADDCLPLGPDDDDYYDWVSSLLLSHDCHDW